MSRRGARVIALWLAGSAVSLWIVAAAHYVTDLSAFLPSRPTALQRLLVEQLADGPASRLVLIALEQGDAGSRARVSMAMARRLRDDAAFSNVQNGETLTALRDRDFLFQHRYLLSSAVTAQRFTVAGLHASIAATIDSLASPAGLMLKSLVPHDPTGELREIVERLARSGSPRSADGVWVSADGRRTLLVAQTAASGSDTDAQERALDAIGRAFRAATAAAAASTGAAAAATGAQADSAAAPSAIRLTVSGPGVFAVAARAKIERAAMRLSAMGGVLVVGVLLAVYRSWIALGLGLLPVATGALFGVAAVALGFGAVHGITLGFGITLIGEAVDYSIYFFIQSLRSAQAGAAPGTWQRQLWPTVRLGMLTSVCGFASLLPSGFPGLGQLGLYSIGGLLAAAAVTRFVLPELLPPGFAIRDLAPLGRRIGALRAAAQRGGGVAIPCAAAAIAALALLVLLRQHATLWNRELSSLSPVPPQDLRYDAALRADLGAANVLDLVIVDGADLQAVLRGAERAQNALEPLVDAGVIGDFDTPAAYLPSLETQRLRRDALPDEALLRRNLAQAVADLDLDAAQLAPFVADVAAARHAPLVTVSDLQGTSLAAGFDALVMRHGERWSALLPLHAHDGAATPDIDVARVTAELAAAHLPDTVVLDLKLETDALYDGYLHEAMRLASIGFAAIVLLLLAALRSPPRVARILAPLSLAVLSVAAGLALAGVQLTLLHLVGMLLIVAVGSNYALFFDGAANRRVAVGAEETTEPLTLASLAVANLSTVIGFGLLSFSQVPVLVALGTTVAPGAFLALMYSALMTPRLAQRATHASS
jgi:predicted exporter